MKPSLRYTLIGAALIAAGAVAWSFWTVPRDSHSRMIRLLAKIRNDDLENNVLYSQTLASAEAKKLETISRDHYMEDKIDLYNSVGMRQLVIGENEAAASNFGKANELLFRLRGVLPPKVENTNLLNLALARLRTGEYQNCIAASACESCIFPIRDTGIHSDKSGSLAAIDQLQALLSRDRDNLTARWLLNIAAMTVGDYPDKVPPNLLIAPSAFESERPFPRFVNVAAHWGVDHLSLSGGVVADDFDNDGRLDLMVSDWGPAGQLRLFKNRGAGKFSDATEQAGLVGLFGGLNLIQADYDNDGDVDLLVLRGGWRGENGRHPNSLLQNDGKAFFRDVTFDAGLGDAHFPTQTAAWADYDNDGDLDLYVGNETHPCQLFQNNGQGVFIDVAERANVTNLAYTKGVVWGDFNGDRFPDLYVSNYGQPDRLENADSSSENFFTAAQGAPNRLYRNNRDGTFSDVANELAVTKPMLGFPAWFWDVNNDGALDIFAASYSGDIADVAAEYLGQPHDAEPDCLYLADGKGGFREAATEFGLHRVALAMGANFGDLDNDGFDDFYLGVGAPAYEALAPNLMFHNQEGKRFADVTTAGGFGHLQKGHGVAFADLDNDGDQDVVCVLGGAFGGDVFPNALFLNPGFKNHWLGLRLVGGKSNRSAIGARIQVDVVESGKTRSIFKWVTSGGSFGANPLRQLIGLGDATEIQELKVFWPTTGQTQTFLNVPVDCYVELVEGESDLRKRTP